MTRHAVQQGRTRVEMETRNDALSVGIGDDEDDGWVSVDNHRRRHRQQTPTAATRSLARGNSAVETKSTTRAAAAWGARADRGAVGNANASVAAGSGAMRRSESLPEGSPTTRSASYRGNGHVVDPVVASSTNRPIDIAPPKNSRADALSAAATLDKKARERSYASQPTSPPTAAARNPSLPPTTTRWGSPPPPTPPLLRLQGKELARSKSMCPDDSGKSYQSRASSLQKLLDSLTVEDEPSADDRHQGALHIHADRECGSNEYSSPRNGMPGNLGLRRSQSDTVTGVSQVKSPTGSFRTLNALFEHATQAVAESSSSDVPAVQPKKCGDKRDFFFRNLDYETRCKLQIDDVASFSVTDFEMAKKISLAILSLFPSLTNKLPDDAPPSDAKYPLTITDATACVGGNVLSFCDFFEHVNAVECDTVRVGMLEHNLGVLKKSNALCLHANYLEVMRTLEQDVVFIDPPWGGPEYKELDQVDLFLGEQPLYAVCEKLRGHAQFVVLKVPTNFDDKKFSANVSGLVDVRKDFKKMHLVIVDFRSEQGFFRR
ncbi:hypothetical protein PINS_up003299 [Pythium insidiosum]|nr:hypothetical protein PINS_up003299 [Pythium insidiosum]